MSISLRISSRRTPVKAAVLSWLYFSQILTICSKIESYSPNSLSASSKDRDTLLTLIVKSAISPGIWFSRFLMSSNRSAILASAVSCSFSTPLSGISQPQVPLLRKTRKSSDNIYLKIGNSLICITLACIKCRFRFSISFDRTITCCLGLFLCVLAFLYGCGFLVDFSSSSALMLSCSLFASLALTRTEYFKFAMRSASSE